MDEKQLNERNINMDFLRIIAIISVVICHATEAVYPLNLSFMNSISLQSKIFGFTAFTLGRLGVPIFIFISGYFLLNREYDELAIKKFWRKNLIPLLITTEIWILLYDIFLSIFNNEAMRFPAIIRNVLFLEQVKMGHMWYMSMILGMYLFIPFVSRAVKHINSVKIITPSFICSVVYITIVPTINEILKATKHTAIHNILSLDFSGAAYGLMLISGYLFLQETIVKKFNALWISLIGIISFIFVIWLQIFGFTHGNQYTVWYNAFPLVLCSACLAIVGIKFANKFINKCADVVSYIAKLAFGIYLVHWPILMLLNRYCHFNVILPVKTAALFLLTFIASLAVVIVVNQSSLLRKYLLYIK